MPEPPLGAFLLAWLPRSLLYQPFRRGDPADPGAP